MTDEPAADDAALARWRVAYRASMQGASAACPSDEALVALVQGEISPDERRTAAAHVVACRACTDNYRLLLQLHDEVRPGHRAHWRWRTASIAAALILAALGAALLWQARQSWMHGGFSEEGIRGPAVSIQPADRASLPAPPLEFIWPAQTGATAYRLRLYDSGGDPVWQPAPVNESRVTVSREIAESLERGRPYFWVVDVDGPVARSRLGPFEFRLGGP